MTKLQQHNSRLAAQLADANKRIARLHFERSILLDKLYEGERRRAAHGNEDTEVDSVTAPLSSDSEAEYRESEWWADVDLAAVLARNPIQAVIGGGGSSVGAATATSSGTVGKKVGKKSTGKRRLLATSTDHHLHNNTVTSEEDGLVDTDLELDLHSSGMLFEFEHNNTSQVGSSPPNANKKRRSNKASAAADVVLKTIPVEYDSDGRPVLPLTVGVVTVESLGEVVYDRPAYHNRRYILPVGYHSTRLYLSTVDPAGQCLYHSRILDGGPSPLFQVTPEDAPNVTFQAPTSTGAWSAVVRAANLLRARDYSNSASGPDYYGLSNATVAMLIEDLPDSGRCLNYQRKRFERGAAHVKPKKDSSGGSTIPTTVTTTTNTTTTNIDSEAIVSGVPSEVDIATGDQ
jgi:hypothetical protein